MKEKFVFAAALASALAGVDVIHRPTLLFRAGEYADKGITVTEADLDALIDRFNKSGEAVPVKAEHLDTPLDPLGTVEVLFRKGPDLYGMLAFSAGMHDHIERRGIKHVSVGLLRDEAAGEGEATGFVLKEASLVFTPRVEGAGFLPEVGAKIAKFCAEGKLTPAMVPAARKLLSAPAAVVTFSDGSASLDVAAVTEELLAALPVVQPRQAAAAAATFAAPAGEPVPSETVKSVAAGFGLDPVTVAKGMKAAAA